MKTGVLVSVFAATGLCLAGRAALAVDGASPLRTSPSVKMDLSPDKVRMPFRHPAQGLATGFRNRR